MNEVMLNIAMLLVALNIQYLIETIKLSYETVLISNSDSLEPVVFDYPETERIVVIMPIRLPD